MTADEAVRPVVGVVVGRIETNAEPYAGTEVVVKPSEVAKPTAAELMKASAAVKASATVEASATSIRSPNGDTAD